MLTYNFVEIFFKKTPTFYKKATRFSINYLDFLQKFRLTFVIFNFKIQKQKYILKHIRNQVNNNKLNNICCICQIDLIPSFNETYFRERFKYSVEAVEII